MWSAGANPWDLYLGTRMAALCDGTRLVLREPVADADAGLRLARNWIRAESLRAGVRVWLSGALCRPFLVQATAGLRGDDEVHKVMQALAQQAMGQQAPCRVWLDSARKTGPRVAVAASEAWITQLEQSVRAATGRVRSVAPWWADVLKFAVGSASGARAASSAQVLAVHDCDALTVLAGAGKGFCIAHTIAPVDDEASARSALSRALLLIDMPAAQPVWVSLRRADSPPSGTPRKGLALASLAEISN